MMKALERDGTAARHAATPNYRVHLPPAFRGETAHDLAAGAAGAAGGIRLVRVCMASRTGLRGIERHMSGQHHKASDAISRRQPASWQRH
jgi:hypothetical protein